MFLVLIDEGTDDDDDSEAVDTCALRDRRSDGNDEEKGTNTGLLY